MIKTLALVLAAATLTSCGGGDSTGPEWIECQHRVSVELALSDRADFKLLRVEDDELIVGEVDGHRFACELNDDARDNVGEVVIL